MTPPTSVQVPHTCSSQYKMRDLPDPDCLACTTTSVQTVTAELLPLTFEGIEDFLCEGNCKNPGMCNDTEITWCGRKAEAFVKSIATLTSSLTAAEARIRELEKALRYQRGELTKLAAECHRAKWQFDFNPEIKIGMFVARQLLATAFGELHRIGDLTLKARDAALSQTEGGAAMSPDKPPKKRPGFRWEYREGCQCKSCPWKGNCLGETRPHWVQIKEPARHE